MNTVVERTKFVLDSHTHTIASGHAYNTINEMVRSAADKGLQLLGITEHAPAMTGACQEIYFQNLKVLPREKYGVRLMFGAELNILDTRGTVDLSEWTLPGLDVGIASMHPGCYESGSRDANTEAYIRVMDQPYINIIGHPDDARFPVDILALVQAAGEKHVLLELNNNSLNPKSFRQNARKTDEEMLRACKKYRVPVILGSDAHTEEDIAEFGYAARVLEAVNFPRELVVNYSVDQYMEYMHPAS